MTKKREILYEGNFIRLIGDNGWEYVQRSNCTGIVVIIAMTDDKKVIFTKQYRPPVKKYCIEFPAGLVNDQGNKKKESMKTAARREFLEEVGYKAKTMTQILVGPTSPGSSSDCLTLFMARGLKKVTNGGGDQTENIEVCEVPLKKVELWLRSMERKGFLVDPKVYAGLYFLTRNINKNSR